MRICDLTTLYIDGGEAGFNTYLREKARFLAQQDGVEHIAIVPGAATGQRVLDRTTVHSIASPRIPWNPLHRLLVNLPSVARILRQFSPDVVEVDPSYILGHVAAEALAGRGARVFGFHHVHLPFHARLMGARLPTMLARPLADITERFSWRYLAWCMRPLERIFVASRDILDRLRARGFDRLEHVPLGVNLSLFQPRDAGRLPAPRQTVLYAGRLNEEKEIEVLFDAFRRLSAIRTGACEDAPRLLVVGEGPMRPLAEAMARDHDNVELRGFLPYGAAMAHVYREADVLVMPGRNESFGLACVEALASGLPVVAISRGGPRDVVTPEVGALARPGDPADLAEKISGVLARAHNGTAHALACSCRSHAEEHFSWERTFRRILDVYEGETCADAGSDTGSDASVRTTSRRSCAEPAHSVGVPVRS